VSCRLSRDSAVLVPFAKCRKKCAAGRFNGRNDIEALRDKVAAHSSNTFSSLTD